MIRADLPDSRIIVVPRDELRTVVSLAAKKRHRDERWQFDKMLRRWLKRIIA